MSEDTTGVLILLTVPRHWQHLPVREIERKLRKQPHLHHFLAKEVKRWADTGAVDLTGLRRFVDERLGEEPR